MLAGTFARLRRRRRPAGFAGSVTPSVQALEQRRLLSVPATENPGGAPNAPFDFTVTATGPDTVQFSFVDSADNETGFVVRRSTAGGPFLDIATLPSAAGAFSTVTYPNAGLDPGQTYAYTAVALNGPYSSSTPAAVSVTTPNPVIQNPGGAPNAPFGFSAVPDATGNGITFSFFDSADNETGFIIERATGENGPFTQIGTLGPGVGFPHLHFDDTTTAPGTTYFYTAVAVNGPYVSSTPAPVSATAPGTAISGGIALDATFASAGDFHDAGTLPAIRTATSPDGATVYALSPGLHGDDTGSTGPVVDLVDAQSGAAVGRINVNQQLAVPFDRVSGLAVQADGKVIVAGNGAGDTIIVARFNADGSPDDSFGNAAGELVVDYGGNEQVANVDVAPDGKIYVGGSHGVFSTPVLEFFAVRLNTDGTLDSGFGFNGISKGGGLGKGGHAAAIAIDPTDGSAIVVGSFLANAPGPFQSALAGARLLPSGIDTDDFLYDEGAAGSGADDVIVQADRKIVVVGDNQFAAEALRLNPDGTKDPTWIGPGAIGTPGQTDTTASFDGVVQLADGSYIAVGQRTSGGQTDALIVRLAATDGAITGNGTGLLVRDLPDASGSSNASYADVALSGADGSIFAAGGDHAMLLLSKFEPT